MDMDTVKMSHEEMIDTLKGLVFGTFDRTTAKEREALDMVIKLQTEPSADVIPITRGATNGDMIKAMFPNGKEYDNDGDVRYEIEIDFDYSFCSYFDGVWWNAPYKGNLSEKPTGSESEG
jgi:muramoyltetrapeptide carboxypeptidase LdcA involved in peptidoglycan recycling